MAKRRFDDFDNLGGGKLRYRLGGAYSVDKVAIADPLSVLDDVELIFYQLGPESGDPPYDWVLVDVGERLFPTLLVTGDWKGPDKDADG